MPDFSITAMVTKALQAMRFGRSGGGGSGAQVVALGGGYGSGYSIWTGQRGEFDYAGEAGDPQGNSVVSVALGWIKDNVTEPEFEVVRKGRDKIWDPVPNHPLTELIANPNPAYDGDTLWQATVVSYCLDGNAYWIKARGSRGFGQPVELWHVPYWRMRPCWPADGSEFISHYEYHINGDWIRYETGDVVHFMDGIDFETRRGVSRLNAVLREILSDNEAAAYTAQILRNMGMPGVLIGPKDGQYPIPEDARTRIEQTFIEKFSGNKRGRPMVSSDALEVVAPGFSPEQLALDRIRAIPAARIAGALRLRLSILNLDASGPSGFDSGGQHKANREAAYEDCLMPIQRRMARTVTRSLLPDFGNPARERAQWCYDEVRALSEDEDAASKRACGEFQGGIATLNEARERRGYEPLPDEDDRGRLFFFELKPAPGAPTFDEQGKLEEPEEPPALGAGLGQPPPESQGDRQAAAQNGAAPANGLRR